MPRVQLQNQSIAVAEIFCVARNYADHVAEMGGTRPPQPVFFSKPNTAVAGSGDVIHLDPNWGDAHHEVELALLVTETLPLRFGDPMSHIGGFGVGVDLTLRELQLQLKKAGLPWLKSKGFEQSCPLSVFRRLDDAAILPQLSVELAVNESLRQRGSTSDMLFDCREIVTHLNEFTSLPAGTVILTGTPAGVGRLADRDRVHGRIPGHVEIQFEVRFDLIRKGWR